MAIKKKPTKSNFKSENTQKGIVKKLAQKTI